MTNELNLIVKRVIPASQQIVFNAWLDVDVIKEFMMPMPGVIISKAEVDPCEGGLFSIVMTVGDQDIPIHGEYKTINKYDELVFSWLSQATSEDSLVTIRFEKISENETEVSLYHKGFNNEEQRNDHEGGWTGILQALNDVLS